jgi:glycosyltransferase involved in cell wall biosynthesis
MSTQPLLTIAVPAYCRANLLQRCLASIHTDRRSTLDTIELLVSDNSPDDNFNLCIERARGRYILIIHDDDYLLPGAVDAMVDVLADADVDRDKAVLFGVRVETLEGKVRRRQEFSRDRYLPPPQAYHRLLSDSAFVRFPALVVQTDAYREVGGYRVEAYTTCDVDMQVRLFGRFGVRCVPVSTAIYTVHSGGVTTTVFNPRTVDLNWRAFEVARATGVLDDDELRALMRRWYHQFILAGALRSFRNRDREAARRVLGLFNLPKIRDLGISLRWLPLRVAFVILAGGQAGLDEITGQEAEAQSALDW